MKKVLSVVIIMLLSFGFTKTSSAQSQELQQLILNIEKLSQFKSILDDMKKGYDILLYGYNAVKDISEGNYSLHKLFLDGLLEVSPTVRQYKRVGEIISYQIALLKEYKGAAKQFRLSSLFDDRELGHITNVYDQLVKESLDCLEDLASVLTARKLRMSDQERLEEIDYIYQSMQDKILFLRSFNNSTAILAWQRLKDKNETQSLKKIYGVE